jgi:catechol 2,3-dioxygenase-like lactoylglutathione lyase family enzyme
MKRFHVHVAVEDLTANIRFYSSAFGVPPTVVKDDYAKWMLEDPRVNFAISARGAKPGLDHLGFQVESDDELAAMRRQIADAGIAALDQPGASCCYANSDKYWTTDPQGIAWETFRSLGSIPVYGEAQKAEGAAEAASCCAPPAQPVNMMKRAAAKPGACC